MRTMKWFVTLMFVVLCAAGPAVFAQGLDDEYVQIFRLIQEADTLSNTSPSQALAKYLDAQAALDRLHKGSPDWNTRIVDYRLSYLADRIATLSATSSPPVTVPTKEVKSGEASVTSAQPTRPTAPPDWQAQINGLQQRAGQLQSEKTLLEAKLKEALAMRPAAVDPAELAKAQDIIKTLQKENDLLKVSAEREKPSPVTTAEAKSLETSQRQLAEANRQLADQAGKLSRISLERDALENRLKQLSASANNNPPATVASNESALNKQLEAERDELKRQLEQATKEKSGKKAKGNTAQLQELQNQLAVVRTRLDLFESRAVPYSAEELALLKRPEAKLTEADPRPGKKSIKELPAGAGKLIAEAQRCFAAKEFDKAEAAYLQVLQQDPKNVPTLANLAAVQIEEDQFDKAEPNIKQALSLDSEDPYSLYVLGLLKLRQAKYDEALDALSHSAKIDPQNAEVQNYLGLALSEKGMRVPAEAALRKAVQLQPGYARAHYNLAVVYATQQPPATELARFHYQKALAAGCPRNSDLEKRFAVRQ